MHRLSNRRGRTLFLKIVRCGWTPGADAEAERTLWAAAYLPVPRVLGTGTASGSSWLLTEGIAGRDATNEAFRDDIPGLVSRLAEGLRSFHKAPAAGCPFQFRVDAALRLAQERLENGLIDPARDFHAEHAHLTAEEALQELVRGRPDSEDLVVCHGDYCVPNILLGAEAVVGYVDLGELGVADRWWDLAVATWSLTWNFGPGYEEGFLASYGVGRDNERIRFYRLLYDLVS